jgi:hypothetical protein
VFTKPFTRTTIFNLTTLLHCTATDFPTESNVQTGSGLKSKSPLFTSMHTRSLGVQINSVERCSTVKAGRSPPVFTRRSSRKDHMKRTATVVVGALLAGAWGKFMLASIDVKVRLQPWVYRYFAVPRGISEDPSRRAIQEYWILPDGRFWVHSSWYSAAFCAATWLIFCAAFWLLWDRMKSKFSPLTIRVVESLGGSLAIAAAIICWMSAAEIWAGSTISSVYPYEPGAIPQVAAIMLTCWHYGAWIVVYFAVWLWLGSFLPKTKR